MRNTRLRILSSLLLISGAISAWGAWAFLLKGHLEWLLVLLAACSTLQSVLAAQVLLAGVKATAWARRLLATAWAVGWLVVYLPALRLLGFGLLSLNTPEGFLQVLSLFSTGGALLTLVLAVVSFLNNDSQRFFAGARAFQQAFNFMLAVGSVTVLTLLGDGGWGYKVSVTPGGAIFYGFWGWQPWNVLLLVTAVALLFTHRLQGLLSGVQIGLFACLPLLVAPVALEFSRSTGLHAFQPGVLIAVASVLAGLVFVTGREVAQAVAPKEV